MQAFVIFIVFYIGLTDVCDLCFSVPLNASSALQSSFLFTVAEHDEGKVSIYAHSAVQASDFLVTHRLCLVRRMCLCLYVWC